MREAWNAKKKRREEFRHRTGEPHGSSTLELKWYVKQALKFGYRVRGKHGGGWIKLCHAICGVPTHINKKEAREFLILRFGTSENPSHKPVLKKFIVKYEHVKTDAFLASYEWRVLRMKALKRDGRRCACCGATPDDGLKMHVDHIRPRKTHPELALDLDNLQVLCEVCNHGKGNWDSTDWRKKPAANDEEEQNAHIRSIVHGRV